MNLTIDGFTPCLEEAATGKIVDTSYSTVSQPELKMLKKWKFKAIPHKDSAADALSDFSSDCTEIPKAY